MKHNILFDSISLGLKVQGYSQSMKGEKLRFKRRETLKSAVFLLFSSQDFDLCNTKLEKVLARENCIHHFWSNLPQQ